MTPFELAMIVLTTLLVVVAIIAAVTVGCTVHADFDHCVEVETGRICVLKTDPPVLPE